MRRIVVITALALAAVPSAARAQGYLAPALGVTFGNPSAQGRANFVADLGWLSRQPVGVELDVMYAPSFFGSDGPYGQNSVTTVMGNVIFAGSGGGGYGRRYGGRSSVRPYVSGGFGVMHETVNVPATSGTISNTDLGVNLGLGVMAVNRRQIGLRAEVRYFRDLVDNNSGNTTNIDFGSFHFWRASIGLVLPF